MCCCHSNFRICVHYCRLPGNKWTTYHTIHLKYLLPYVLSVNMDTNCHESKYIVRWNILNSVILYYGIYFGSNIYPNIVDDCNGPYFKINYIFRRFTATRFCTTECKNETPSARYDFWLKIRKHVHQQRQLVFFNFSFLF